MEDGCREGGHPLKRQRGTGRGETRRRAKDDARRTKKGLDQWEGRKIFLGKKRWISVGIGGGEFKGKEDEGDDGEGG